MVGKRIIMILMTVFITVSIVGCGFDVEEYNPPSDLPRVFDIHNSGHGSDIGDYSETEKIVVKGLQDKGLRDFKVVDSSLLNNEVLRLRGNTTIIERCVGFVTDKEARDGVVLNTYESSNYISYKSCGEELFDGTILVSYLVYRPGEFDVSERYDFVVCREYED